jgi:hypothetical protein
MVSVKAAMTVASNVFAQEKHDDDGRLSIAVWAAASYVLVMSDCFSLSLYASSKWAFVVLGIVVLSSLPLQLRA